MEGAKTEMRERVRVKIGQRSERWRRQGAAFADNTEGFDQVPPIANTSSKLRKKARPTGSPLLVPHAPAVCAISKTPYHNFRYFESRLD